MDKPSWFSVYDLLTIGLGAIVSSGLLIYAIATTSGSARTTQGLILLGAVCVCFVAIYGFYLFERRRWIQQFVWIPEYRMMVKFGKYKSSAAQISQLTKATINAWAPYHPMAEQLLKSEVNWVFFERGLDELPPTHVGIATKVKGFALVGTHTIVVDYNDAEPTSLTAFEHELGHILHGLSTRQWDQEEHHKFAAERGLK